MKYPRIAPDNWRSELPFLLTLNDNSRIPAYAMQVRLEDDTLRLASPEEAISYWLISDAYIQSDCIESMAGRRVLHNRHVNAWRYLGGVKKPRAPRISKEWLYVAGFSPEGGADRTAMIKTLEARRMGEVVEELITAELINEYSEITIRVTDRALTVIIPALGERECQNGPYDLSDEFVNPWLNGAGLFDIAPYDMWPID